MPAFYQIVISLSQERKIEPFNQDWECQQG
jgi:hypothetical protein